jgi:hypothetical protein
MMTFDLRIITVGYDEWTLWASLAMSTTFAVLFGAEVGKRVARVRIAWLRWLTGAVTLGALWFGMAVGSLLAFGLLFMVANGGASVCTVLVGRALLIPSFAVVASEAFGWWRVQRAEVGEAAEQGDEADEAKHIGASQLIPGVRRTHVGAATEAR